MVQHAFTHFFTRSKKQAPLKRYRFINPPFQKNSPGNHGYNISYEKARQKTEMQFQKGTKTKICRTL